MPQAPMRSTVGVSRGGFRYERVEFLNMKRSDVAPRQIFSIQETLFRIEKKNQNIIEFIEEKFCLV
jgi:hypothetical protein